MHFYLEIIWCKIMNNNLTYGCRVLNINKITHDSNLFTVKLIGLSPNYKKGQYIILSKTINNKEYRRSYSIVNFNPNKKELSFIVKRIENGIFSRILNDYARVGDTLGVVGINGFFTLPEDLRDYQQIFFIAAGSGIAPIFPMIEDTLRAGLTTNLLYSSKSAASTIFYKELNQLQQEHTDLTVHYLFSATGAIGKSRLNNTLLTDYLKQQAVTSYEKILFYVCGPLDYMDTVSITLLTEGVPKSNIKKEVFYNYEVEELPVPEDTDAHKVTLVFQDGATHSLEVRHPKSILNTALEAGLKMPYSCGSGQCGSCTAKVISGKVWMAYNEVLTDRELAQGYTLTCMGFPIDGDVVLEF